MENMLLLIPVNDIFAASSVTMLWLISLSLSSLLLNFYLYQLGIGEGGEKKEKPFDIPTKWRKTLNAGRDSNIGTLKWE